ncbi:hypothetical protein ACFE04_004057 [Oxalis oulophora]
MTKFSFLIEYLGGKIHEVVKRLSVTESSFHAAIIRLNERYDNPEQLETLTESEGRLILQTIQMLKFSDLLRVLEIEDDMEIASKDQSTAITRRYIFSDTESISDKDLNQLKRSTWRTQYLAAQKLCQMINVQFIDGPLIEISWGEDHENKMETMLEKNRLSGGRRKNCTHVFLLKELTLGQEERGIEEEEGDKCSREQISSSIVPYNKSEKSLNGFLLCVCSAKLYDRESRQPERSRTKREKLPLTRDDTIYDLRTCTKKWVKRISEKMRIPQESEGRLSKVLVLIVELSVRLSFKTIGFFGKSRSSNSENEELGGKEKKNIERFTSADLKYLEFLCDILEPLAQAVDILQGVTFYVTLASTIHTLYTRYSRMLADPDYSQLYSDSAKLIERIRTAIYNRYKDLLG